MPVGLKRFPHPRFLRDLSLAGGGVGVARLVSLVTLVILVHRLEPSDFGLFSIGWVIYLVVGQLLSGLDLGYVDLQSRDQHDEALLAGYRRLKMQASVLLGALVAVALPLLGAAMGWNGEGVVLAVVGGVAGATYALFQSELSALQARRKFSEFALWTIGLNLVVLVVVAGLALMGVRSPTPYMAAYAVVGLAFALWVCLPGRASKWSDLAAARRLILWRHSSWLLASSLLYGVGQRAELLVAAALLGQSELGLYSAPARFFTLLELGLAAVGTVLLPRASVMRGGTQVRTYLRGAGLATALVGICGVLVTWQADMVTRVLIGDSYADAAQLLPVFAVAGILLTANATLKYLLFTVKRPKALAVMNSTLLVTKVGAAAALVPVLGALGAAWALVVAYGAGTFVVGTVVLANRGMLSGDSGAGAGKTGRRAGLQGSGG